MWIDLGRHQVAPVDRVDRRDWETLRKIPTELIRKTFGRHRAQSRFLIRNINKEETSIRKGKTSDISKVPQIRIRIGTVNFLQKIGKKRVMVLVIRKTSSR